MMNQENSPAGSYAVLGQAAEAAVEFINSELGGLDGREIRLSICDVGFSAQQSIQCAQRLVDEGAVAVLGGVDVFGDGIQILGSAGVAYVGGLPISEISATAENSFQWSGGAWSAAVAFAHDAVQRGDHLVVTIHPDFGPINQAAEFAAAVLRAAGVRTSDVPFQITDQDLMPALQTAKSAKPDSIMVLGADTGCRSALKAAYDLNLGARKYFLGACAAPSVTGQLPLPATDGVVFNVEGPISESDPDTVLYGAAMNKYASGTDPVGAATVSFRSVLNLYRTMVSAASSGLSRRSLLAALDAASDQPSFMGHSFTCDHEQMPGLPALCSPQQILIQMRDGRLVPLGSWIDVGSIRAASR